VFREAFVAMLALLRRVERRHYRRTHRVTEGKN
jgi:hypothetical protein